jgi:hypothetical protein
MYIICLGNIIYKNVVQVVNLTANQINNYPAEKLVTRYTSQNISDFYIDTLHVQHLQAKTINGVPVDKAARVSQENVIKGS